ncbi:MAG: hypothetical protein IT300_14120 [Dehalococcoidia bacterium]|nr:hypothetical protein [Dehalococcoidia bacterium]
MKCPRCASPSIVSSHASISCLSCGHAVTEPARQAWDKVSSIRGASKLLGPAWTDAEHALWRSAEVTAGR